ncbi:MAG: DUF6325 family protein [Actinomycetes bacterium]|jgi:hypothetical protein
MTSPVQVLVIGFDEPQFSGEALAELARLKDAGIVQLVDLLVVERTAGGELQTLPSPGVLGPGAGDIAVALLAESSEQPASPTRGDVNGFWSLAEAIPAGSMAVVALIEHLWAEPLAASVRKAGGRALEETWLALDDLDRLTQLRSDR